MLGAPHAPRARGTGRLARLCAHDLGVVCDRTVDIPSMSSQADCTMLCEPGHYADSCHYAASQTHASSAEVDARVRVLAKGYRASRCQRVRDHGYTQVTFFSLKTQPLTAEAWLYNPHRRLKAPQIPPDSSPAPST
ncbi:hypothetical protein EXIGLDRAFT_51305 [Exidia glandulosa HHB12029]|uniref:Uncharacterized protein n=1 Tax=Exidia glandulosa HHB12029 TaxID=1314781 RepID=A0A165IEI9_EXIGL|nr:hypothetical protein EXIGLDRAFT_51305 [Exidia glandulosa HHB12029]